MNRALPLAASTLLLAVAAASAQDTRGAQASPGRAHLDAARAAGDKGDWRGAVLECNRALRSDPSNAEVYIRLGAAYGELKEWDEALRALRRAVALVPSSAAAHYNLGVTLERAKPGSGAGIPEFRKALELDPRAASAMVNLAVGLGDQSPQEARRLLERAGRLDPRSAEVPYNLGLLLRNAGERARAIEAFQKAVALNPDFLDARRQLALLLVAAERWDENLEQCREILKRDARDWNARYSLGQTLIRRGLEEEGRRELQRAQETRRAEQARQDAEKAIGRGVAALRAGKPEAAAAEFRAALETDARSALAHMYLGMALASLDQRQDGLAELDRAVELEPQGARARHNRGTLLLQLGRAAEARADFDRALELDPYFAETHNNLGMILAATGDPRAALEHFRLATEIDPGYVEGLFNLGLCLRSLGRLDEAIAALRRAARRAPDNRQVQSALETCLKERAAAPKRNPGPRP